MVNLMLLSKIINAACEEYGYECDLNWIDVSTIDNMAWLFGSTAFNGDISRWDVSHVTNMNCMFRHSHFNGNISGWNTASVKTMY